MASAESIIAAKKASIIGLGRLGLCTALVWANKGGWEIMGSDIFPDYVDRINKKTLNSLEPEVTDYLKACTKLTATTSMDDTLAFSDMIFILVATPNGAGTNAYDHSTLSKVLDDINSRKIENKHLVICCTVMPGYIAKFGRYLIRDCPGCTLSYHPEFIAQGEIIKGLRFPDMVLIGEGSKDAGAVIEQMNHDCTDNEPRIARMSAESAEITKLTVNCFVTTKISFANSIGDLADVTPGANKFDILGAVGADSRVGGKCLRPGYGFGGPCFPRDNRALGKYMEAMGIATCIPRATDDYNNFHADFMAKAHIAEDKEEYVFTDVAYKPNCAINMIEESQPLRVALKIAEAGKKVKISDREGIISMVRREFGPVFEYEVLAPTAAAGGVTADVMESSAEVHAAGSPAEIRMGNPMSSYSK